MNIWRGLICIFILVILGIEAVLRLKTKRVVKIIHHGDATKIRAKRRQEDKMICDYTDYQLSCNYCGCRFELVKKSRLRESLENGYGWMARLDCPDCGEEVSFQLEQYEWEQSIKGKSQEEIIEMMIDRDAARTDAKKEKISKGEPHINIGTEEEVFEEEILDSEPEPPKEDGTQDKNKKEGDD